MSNFDWYIKNEYTPAQDWYKNGGGIWIKKYIPNYSWIMEHYNSINLGVYKITLNDHVAYIGEAVKVSNRLVVHAWNVAKDSKKKFGVLQEEIEGGVVRINMTCIESDIQSSRERKRKESEYIEKLHPFLQMNEISTSSRKDLCISRTERRDVTRSNLGL